MAPAPVTPRQAGTVVLLREAPAGPEVLMLRRPRGADFAADAWVFPGGAVEPADRRLPPDRWRGIAPEALAARLGAPPEDVLGFHVAAVRETFEEGGLLLAHHDDGRPVDPRSGPAQEIRRRLADPAGDEDFAAWLASEQLVLDLGALVAHGRWVTPAQSPKRFDACFFLSAAPDGQAAVHDGEETTDQRWVAPEAALARAARGEMLLWYPTEQTLRGLAAAGTVEAALTQARRKRAIRRVQPHLEAGPDGHRLVHPDEPGYPHERYAPGGDLADAGPGADTAPADAGRGADTAPAPGARR